MSVKAALQSGIMPADEFSSLQSLYCASELLWPSPDTHVTVYDVHEGIIVGISASDPTRLEIVESQSPTVLHKTHLQRHALRCHSSGVYSVSVSRDGKHIVSGSVDQTVLVWNSESGECLKTLKGHTDSISSVSFVNDGTWIVSGGEDQTVRLWDFQSGECLKTFEGHSDTVTSVSYCSGRQLIASGSEDQSVRLWDLETAECVAILDQHTNFVTSVSFSGDGGKLASGSGDQTVRVWDTDSSECLHTLDGHSDTVWSVSFSVDCMRVASGSDDQTIRVWDVESGQSVKVLVGHTQTVWSVSFSVDGSQIVSGSGDKTVRVWDAETGQCLRVMNGHSDTVWSAVFCGDTLGVVSGSKDETVRVWKTESGRCLRTLNGHTAIVSSVGFRNNGKLIVSCSDDGTVHLWDVNSGAICYSGSSGSPEHLKQANGSGCQVHWTLHGGELLIWAMHRESNASDREAGASPLHLVGLVVLETGGLAPSNVPVLLPHLLTSPLLAELSTFFGQFTARCPHSGFDTSVVPDWSQLHSLRSFDVSDTPVPYLPPSLSNLHHLRRIDIRNCGVPVIPTSWSKLLDMNRPDGPFPRDGLCIDETQLSALPRALREKAVVGLEPGHVDAHVILGYLRDLRVTTPVTRIRMVTVGPAAAGKTFLSRALSKISNPKSDNAGDLPGSTVGVDTFAFSQKVSVFDSRKRKVVKQRYHIDIWDFAGHEEYFPIHSLLFSELVQYLLVVNAKKMEDSKSHVAHFRKWLSAISTRAPTGRVVLVFSQADRIKGWDGKSRDRVKIAERIAINGRKQALEALPSGSGLIISTVVLVVDSRKPRFLVVDDVDSRLIHAQEHGVKGVRECLVDMALEYMGSQSIFQGNVLPDEHVSGKSATVAPVVPESYVLAMHAIEDWAGGRGKRQEASVMSVLRRIFKSEERAAVSKDVMTFGELCTIMRSVRINSGDEFERVLAVLQSWGVLFYFGNNSRRRFNQQLADTNIPSFHTHSDALGAANTTAELVFVNPRVLVDITAHLYVRHHLQTLRGSVGDDRLLGSRLFSDSILHKVNVADPEQLFANYGIASRSLLRDLFLEVERRHGLNIDGLLDLIEAMQLVYRMDMHLPRHWLPSRCQDMRDPSAHHAVAVPVFIIPSLVSERRPRSDFPCVLRSVPQAQHHAMSAAYFDFELEFNTTGLLSFVVHWTMQCKKIAEKRCETKGEMWHGGSDIYGGANTIARIHWIRHGRESMDVESLGTGDSEFVRVQGGPLRGVTGDDPSVRAELYSLMRTVFECLNQLLFTNGAFAGIRLYRWKLPSPCTTAGHWVYVSYEDILKHGSKDGVLISRCEGCERSLSRFSPQLFRLPFGGRDTVEIGTGGGEHTLHIPISVTCESPDEVPAEVEQVAVSWVGERVIPSRNVRRLNDVARAASLKEGDRTVAARAGDIHSMEHLKVTMKQLEQKVEDQGRVLAEHTEDLIQQRILNKQLREATETVRSQLTKLLMTYNAEVDTDVPRLFILVPEERSWWKRFTRVEDLFTKPHRLFILCESRTGPHIPPGHKGYGIHQPRAYVQKFGKQIARMLKLLSFTLRAASFLPGAEVVRNVFGDISEGVRGVLEDEDLVKKVCKAFKSACDNLRNADMGGSLPGSGSLSGDGSSPVHVGGAGHASIRRSWQDFIDEIDMSNDRGGLNQSPLEWGECIQYTNGDVHRRWLCADCFQDAREAYESRVARREATGSEIPTPNAELFVSAVH